MAPSLVHRPRLFESGFSEAPVYLVCAPAGYGKTTLLAEWSEEAHRQGDSVAWLSLVDHDDDLYQFWSAVIDALAVTSAGRATGGFDQLLPPQRNIEPQFIAMLTSTIELTPGLRWLVLDDVQKLSDPALTASLDLLLGALPPDFGVVLVCRSDPALRLNGLRLAGQLRELRADDLAFTDEEASEMLARLEIPIEPDDLQRLVDLTEGWAAGLRLAAVSLTASSDVPAFVASFDGDERAVADYLIAEILKHQPATLVDFLMSTCAPEQLSGSLAAALSGIQNAGEILDQLSRANALVMQSGDTAWFRYHSLLRGHLAAAAQRRDPNEIGRQHRVAAAWFDGDGQPALALEHAAQAGDDEFLLAVLESHGLQLVVSGRGALVRSTVDSASPRVRSHPVAATIAALACLDLGDLAGVDGYLTLAEAPNRAADDRVAAIRDCVVVQRSLLARDVGAVLASTGILGRTVTGDTDLDLIVLASRAPSRARTGDREGAMDDLSRALRLAYEGGYDEFVLSILSQLSWIAAGVSDFAAMKRWSLEAIELAALRGWASSPRLAYSYIVAASVGFATGDAEDLSRNAERAVDCLAADSPAEAEVGGRTVLALARMESAEAAQRHALMSELRGIWRTVAASHVGLVLVGWSAPQVVRLALSVGELQWAAEVVEQVEERFPKSAEALLVRAQLAASRGRVSEALGLLGPVLRREATIGAGITQPAALVLTAVLRDAAGDKPLAHDALREAVEWCAPRQYRRPFIDTWREVQPLLAASVGRFGHGEEFVASLFGHAQAVTPLAGQRSALGILTARELELLCELPSQTTLAQLADAKSISLNTVKTHLSSVYRKLGVETRYAAVREARRLGLI